MCSRRASVTRGRRPTSSCSACTRRAGPWRRTGHARRWSATRRRCWATSYGSSPHTRGCSWVSRNTVYLSRLLVRLGYAACWVGEAGDGSAPVGSHLVGCCLLYTSDAADDLLCVDLGGRR